jgi:hypothetical protein
MGRVAPILAGFLSLFLGAPQDPKLPVPSAEEQTRAEKIVRDVFKAEYGVKTMSGQQILARKLLQQGVDTKDDPGAQYVLLRESVELSARSADLETLQSALDELCLRYEVDAWALKGSALSKAEPLLTKAEDLKKLAEGYLKVARGALDLDQFDLAARSAQAALAISKKAKDLPLSARADSMGKLVAELKTAAEKAKKAEQTLATNSEDPGANLVLGEHLCLTKGRWREGLARLAKASEGPLKTLAAKELAAVADLTSRVQVADGWWDLAESEKNPARKENLLAHARSIYEAALPQAEGLLKMKITQRAGPAPVPPAVQNGLVGQWLFNEGKGTRVADSSGKGNHGEVNGTLRWVSGLQGKAGDFDGQTFVACGTQNLPRYGAPMTIAWAHLIRKAFQSKRMILCLDDAESKLAVSVGYNEKGWFGVWKWGEEWLATAPGPDADEWHHFAYTFDGKTHRLFKDGAVASNTTVGLSPIVPFKRLELGRFGGGGGFEAGFYWDGSLKDVRIYDRALSDAEVRSLLGGEKGSNAQDAKPEAGVPGFSPLGAWTKQDTGTVFYFNAGGALDVPKSVDPKYTSGRWEVVRNKVVLVYSDLQVELQVVDNDFLRGTEERWKLKRNR